MLTLLSRAARGLRRSPGFTALCVLTLAVGIGADTAVWSVLDAVLLRPLPYPRSERLMWIGHTVPGLGLSLVGLSDGTYALYRAHQRSFSDLALYRAGPVNLAGEHGPVRVPAATATASLFHVLGVGPRLGRSFDAAEDRPGGRAVALVGDRLARQLGGGARPRPVVGRLLRIDGVPTEVIGVMPAGFAFPDLDTELWLPRRVDPERTNLAELNDDAVGRLSPGATRRSATADLERTARALERWVPGRVAKILVGAHIEPVVMPLRDQQVGDVGQLLWILFGAVGCILAIACANVANLLLVRGEGRQRELAIHAALGAPRRLLLGGVLAESLLIGLAAGAAGVALAWGGLRLLAALRPPALSRLTPASLDLRTLAFAALLSVVTSLLFGLVPAWRAGRRAALASDLKGSGRALTAGRGRRRLRQLLVALQLALAVVLLAGASLMLLSFRHLVAIDPGFDARSVLTLEISLPEAEYPDDAAAARCLDAAVARIAALPGVDAAAAVSFLPLTQTALAGHDFADYPRAPTVPPPVIDYRYVTSGYFRTMGIPLVAGRDLDPAAASRRTGEAVVSLALARRWWPHGSALGRRLRPQKRGSKPTDPWYTIVGVVGNVRHRALTDEAPEEAAYYPVLPKKPGAWSAREMMLAVRTRVAPESLAPAVRHELAGVAPDVPAANLRTLDEVLHGARSQIEFSALMVLLATAVALGLGAIGLYGFVSYLVGLRTAEIGIRMAMGASGRRIRWMILGEAGAITAVGLGVGLAGAAALGGWMQGLLYEVSPRDPLAFSAAPLLLAAATLAASYLPAERAARIEPRVALERGE
ncbi:MAG TPA: ADOP family duplicated permease [Thermoanaerobaculia bacterium]